MLRPTLQQRGLVRRTNRPDSLPEHPPYRPDSRLRPHTRLLVPSAPPALPLCPDRPGRGVELLTTQQRCTRAVPDSTAGAHDGGAPS